jgi:hypothetical protein
VLVTDITKKIEDKFGKMTVTRGAAHVLLGMHITYNDDGTPSIGMREYLEETIEDFGGEITRFAASPAKRDQF